MAESNRQSSSRKRATEQDELADESPIVQLPHAQLCGCDEGWKKAVVRLPFRHSARLRAKNPEQADGVTAMDHERAEPKNSFVYEGYELTDDICWSPDARYMYAITEQAEVLVVDLTRNVCKLWKAPTKWVRESSVTAVVVVGFNTILTNTVHSYGGNDISQLHLLRIPADAEAELYERTLLHPTLDRHTTFVLTEITGGEVDVKRLVVGGSGPLVFLRLDLDERSVIVQHTTTHPELRWFAAQMSEDGTRLYTLDERSPNELHVYALNEQKWTKEELDGVDVNKETFRVSGGPKSLFAKVNKFVNGCSSSFLCRCNFEAKMWDSIPLPLPSGAELFPVDSAVDGQADGILAVQRSYKSLYGCDFTRLKIERFMFRNPDSLKLLSLLAFRKSRELVVGKESFHQKIDEPPLKVQLEKWVPIHFEGMKPIPVRRLE